MTHNKRKYKSSAFEAIHSAAEGLYKVNAISKETMREFDESCLVTPHEFNPKQIKKLREKLKISQLGFPPFSGHPA